MRPMTLFLEVTIPGKTKIFITFHNWGILSHVLLIEFSHVRTQIKFFTNLIKYGKNIRMYTRSMQQGVLNHVLQELL